MESDHLAGAPNPEPVATATYTSPLSQSARDAYTTATASACPSPLTSASAHASSSPHIESYHLAGAPNPEPVDNATHTSPLSGSAREDFTNATASARPSPLTSASAHVSPLTHSAAM